MPESSMIMDDKPIETDHSTMPPTQISELCHKSAEFQEVVFQQGSTNPSDRHNSTFDYVSDRNHTLVTSPQRSQSQQPDSIPAIINDGFPNGAEYGPTFPLDYQSNLQLQPGPFGFDASFDESTNLNWIPLSVYPSPYGDLEQDFAFLLPPFSDSASLGTSYDPTQFDHSMHNTSDNRSAQNSTPELHHTAPISQLGRSPASSTSERLTHGRPLHRIGTSHGTRKRRRKSSQVQEAFTRPLSVTTAYGFPDTSQFHPEEPSHLLCDEQQYSSILMAFNGLCTMSILGKIFTTSYFPRIALVNHFIDLYFEHFHPTFPLIHRPTFGPNTPWITTLAVAAIGSNFSSVSACIEVRESFAELLRRCIVAAREKESDNDGDDSIVHARILHLINVAQSDRISVRSTAPIHHAELSRWCLESGLLQLTEVDDVPNQLTTAEDQSETWQRWLSRESCRRVGYLIWYLDCAFGYLCNVRPLCNMDDARAPLPCSESLWEASSAEEWYGIKKNTPIAPSLCVALEQMYNRKRVPSGLSDISHVILIHALYSRTWEVGTHIKQPLSEWRSTGNSRGFLNTPTKDNFWLPLYPLYANWRNSACDCLDVLHWNASGVIARASGFEHPVILQLHLARIILLTPFQEIQDLLFFLIGQDIGEECKATYYVHDGSYQRRNPSKLGQIRKIIWRWLREDQHKARLAMIHAGNVFWHVKRYSSRSFFEPLAVYLAATVLWTYGTYKSAALEHEAADASGTRYGPSDGPEHSDSSVQPTRVEMAARGHGSSKTSITTRSSQQYGPTEYDEPRIDTQGISEAETSEGEDDQDQPEFIHLDRPCDDEIVQHFVRNGHNMAGYMSNVGDICKTPKKVLHEGAKLLRAKLGCWGVSRNYYDVLCQVSELRKGGKEEQVHRQ